VEVSLTRAKEFEERAMVGNKEGEGGRKEKKV